MDALLLHELWLWVCARVPGLGVTSLLAALDPPILLAVLAQIVPRVPGEPDLSQVRGDTETLLTVYLNACRRLGVRSLFAAASHPSSPGAGDDADLRGVLANLAELRALAAARDAGDGAPVEFAAPAAAANAVADARGHGPHSDTPPRRAAPNTSGGPPALTYAEHCALYLGTLPSDVGPLGRERLWSWLLACEPSCVRPATDAAGRAQAGSAARRINEARRALGASGSADDELVLLHMLESPGHGLVLVRRRLVRALVRAGLPPRMRGMLWARFLGGGDGPPQPGAHRISGPVAAAGGVEADAEAAEGADGLAAAVSARAALLPAAPIRELEAAAGIAAAAASAAPMDGVSSRPDTPLLGPSSLPAASSASSPLSLVAAALGPGGDPASNGGPSSSHPGQAPALLLAASVSSFPLYDRLVLANAVHLVAAEAKIAAENASAAAAAAVAAAGDGDGTDGGRGAGGGTCDSRHWSLPCHLRAFVPDLLAAAAADGGGVAPPQSPTPRLAALTGFPAASAKAVAQVEADLRRTLPHLAPLEGSRIAGPAVHGAAAHHHGAEHGGEQNASSSSSPSPSFSVAHIYCARAPPTLANSTAAAAVSGGCVPPCPHARACSHCPAGQPCFCPTRPSARNTAAAHAPAYSPFSSTVTCAPFCAAGNAPRFVLGRGQEGASSSSSSPSSSSPSAVTVSAGALRRILLAFASYFPPVGYCQGLNWLAAHLLRWCGEHDSFALLTLLVARVFPASTFTDLSGAAVDGAVFGEVLSGALPSLVSHLARLAGAPGPSRAAKQKLLRAQQQEAPHKRGSAAGGGAEGGDGGQGGEGSGRRRSSEMGAGGGGAGPSFSSSSAAAGGAGASGGVGTGGGGAAPVTLSVTLARDPKPALEMLTSVTLRWFVVAFAFPFPPAFTDRVWDSLLFEGGKTLHRTALALARLATPRVLAAKTFPDALAAFDRIPDWTRHWRVYASLFDAWTWPDHHGAGAGGRPPVALVRAPQPSPPHHQQRLGGRRSVGKRSPGVSAGSSPDAARQSASAFASPASDGSGLSTVDEGTERDGEGASGGVGGAGRAGGDGAGGRRGGRPVSRRRAGFGGGGPRPVTATTMGLRSDRRDLGHGVSGAALAWLLADADGEENGAGAAGWPGRGEGGGGAFFSDLSSSSSSSVVAGAATAAREDFLARSSQAPKPGGPRAASTSGASQTAAAEELDDELDAAVDDGADGDGGDEEGEDAEEEGDDEEEGDEEEGDGDGEDEEGDEEGDAAEGDDNDAPDADAATTSVEDDASSARLSRRNGQSAGREEEVEGGASTGDDGAESAGGAPSTASTPRAKADAADESASARRTSETSRGSGAGIGAGSSGAGSFAAAPAFTPAQDRAAAPRPAASRVRSGVRNRYGNTPGARSAGSVLSSSPPAVSGGAPSLPPSSSVAAQAAGLSQRALLARGFVDPASGQLLSSSPSSSSLPPSMALVWRERVHVSAALVRSRRAFVRAAMAEEARRRREEDADEDGKGSATAANSPAAAAEGGGGHDDGASLPAWLAVRLSCADGERLPAAGDGDGDEMSPGGRPGTGMEVGAPRVELFWRCQRLLSLYYRDPRSGRRPAFGLSLVEGHWRPAEEGAGEEIRFAPVGLALSGVDGSGHAVFPGAGGEGWTGEGDGSGGGGGGDYALPVTRLLTRGRSESTVAFRAAPSDPLQGQQDAAVSAASAGGGSLRMRRRSSVSSSSAGGAPASSSLVSFLLGGLFSSSSSSAQASAATTAAAPAPNGGKPSRPASLRLFGGGRGGGGEGGGASAAAAAVAAPQAPTLAAASTSPHGVAEHTGSGLKSTLCGGTPLYEDYF
jgi:hypothetical protein